jgi:hypothetical protein
MEHCEPQIQDLYKEALKLFGLDMYDVAEMSWTLTAEEPA